MELEGAAGGGEVFELDSLLHAVRYGLISCAFTGGFSTFRRKIPLALAVELEGAAGGGEIFDLDSLLRALRDVLKLCVHQRFPYLQAKGPLGTYLSYDI